MWLRAPTQYEEELESLSSIGGRGRIKEKEERTKARPMHLM